MQCILIIIHTPALHPLLLFKQHIDSDLCFPYRCGAIHCSMANLPGATRLKKTDFPPPEAINRQQLLSYGWVLKSHILPHGRILIGSMLCRSCADNHSCSELMSTEVLPCPQDSFALVLHNLTSGSF